MKVMLVAISMCGLCLDSFYLVCFELIFVDVCIHSSAYNGDSKCFVVLDEHLDAAS